MTSDVIPLQFVDFAKTAPCRSIKSLSGKRPLPNAAPAHRESAAVPLWQPDRFTRPAPGRAAEGRPRLVAGVLVANRRPRAEYDYGKLTHPGEMPNFPVFLSTKSFARLLPLRCWDEVKGLTEWR